MGLGRFGGGLDSALFACSTGAEVTVTDTASAETLKDTIVGIEHLDITFHLGEHIADDFRQNDIVIVNPAVGPENRFLGIAEDAGLLVTSQMEIFFQLCRARIVGITGANGKSTTTALTAHLLDAGTAQGIISKVWLGGNIGERPLLTELDEINPEDIVVLELSSFQLEQLGRIGKAPHASVITNLTPNHLDRHKTFDAYCLAKENIFRYQPLNADAPAFSLFNADDPITASWFDRYRGQTGRNCLSFTTDDVPSQLARAYTLVGKANLSNLAAARKVALHFGISDELIESVLPDFKSLPHRLQLVACIRDVSWYNDSIATTPPSAIAGLDAFEAPAIIIAGGYDKQLPFDELGEKIAQRARAAILIGTTAKKIAAAIEASPRRGDTIVRFASSMPEAVAFADEIAKPGDVVLLSPACASYDMFDNFRQRGDIFSDCVRTLEK